MSGEQNKQINEDVGECGMGMQNQAPAVPQTPPVSMNVNMNAQGIEQIKELLSLVANSTPAEEPMPAASTEMPITIKKIAGPEEDPLTAIMAKAGLPPKAKPETEEDYANSPDETVSDINASVPNGDDLHRSKKQYAKAQDGDNAMAIEGIRSQLDRLYKEIKEGKKSKPDFLDVDKDGNKKEPMKKAIKDKKVDEAKFEKSGVRATDKKKGKVDKTELKQYFVKLEKDGVVKGMTVVADEGESEWDVENRVKTQVRPHGWNIAGMRVKEV